MELHICFLFVDVIGHSDPTKLKDAAKSVQRLSDDELKQRQIELQVDKLLGL